MTEDKNTWFSRRKKDYPTDKDWTFPDIESAFKAMQRDMKEKQKEISKVNQHVPTYFGSMNNKKINNKRHFIQGYKITTTPDGKTKITRFGNRFPKKLKPRIQTTKIQEPLLDVIQTEKDVMVVIELPGVKITDVKIVASRTKLLITAKKPNSIFSKEIVLPTIIHENKASAIYKNGVLTITLPIVKN